MDLREGYQIIAMGAEKYAIMAESCAISIRHIDSSRPIQIVTDRPERFQSNKGKIFDIVTPCRSQDELLKGPLIKLTCHHYSSFERTLFVDCDCIAFDSIDVYWEKLQSFDFSVVGQKATRGGWYGANINDLCERFSVPYVVKMNSGVIYFNTLGGKVFDHAWKLYEQYGNFLNHDHRGCGAPDEPYLGIAMGALGLGPIWHVEGERELMVSTIRGQDFNLDLESGNAHYIKGHGAVNPLIVHFVGSKPKDIYMSLIESTREKSGLVEYFKF